MNRLFEAISKDEAFSAGGVEFGITWRKLSEYLGLFCFLLVIYGLCISHYVRFIDAEPASGYGFGDLMKPLIGTCLISVCPSGGWLTETRPGAPPMPLESSSASGLRSIPAFRSDMTEPVHILLLCFWH